MHDKVKLITVDLDGTLLRNDKTISDYTVSILKECQSKDIKIAFATARSIQASSNFIERFNPDIFIGYGGAISLANGIIISRFAIPADISDSLIADCLRTERISTVFAINEKFAYTNSTTNLSHYKCVNFFEHQNISYLKISLISECPETVEKISSNYPMLDMLRYTGENLYRFADRRAVKWNAVKKVAEYYNIEINKIAAFGDDVNDLEMIYNCGFGVAVENAVSAVKEAAKYICGNNEKDGVAKWINERI